MASAKNAVPSAFERWELPNVGPDVPPGRRIPVGVLTAAQVEAVQNQAFEEATRDGHAEGFAKGFDEGLEAGRRDATAACERLASIMQCLAEPLTSLDEELETALLALTLSVARQLIRRELNAEPELVMRGIQHALSALGSVEREVTLFLHREDLEVVKSIGAEAIADGGWKLIEDPTISPGGCRVRSGCSYIDASIEHRVAATIEQVLGLGADNPPSASG